MKNQKNSIRKWAKENKKRIITGVCVAIGVGTAAIIVWKNWDKAVHVLSSSDPFVPDQSKYQPVLSSLPDFLKDIPLLQGETYLPTELGHRVWASPQTINKRLIEAGLQERYSPSYPGYILTEKGKLFGKYTTKGDYKNIEWDINVLYMIFTGEEIQDIADKQLKAKRPAIPISPISDK